MRGVRVDPERRELRTLRRYLDRSPGRVVDVGIGSGRLTRRLFGSASWVVGVDPVVAYLDRARPLARRWGSRLRLAYASGEALPLRSRGADVVLLSWSL